MTLPPEAIDYAVQRFEDLATVHKGTDFNNKVEAVNRFAESVGIDQELREHLATNLMRIVSSTDDLAFTGLGVFLGLKMAEYVHDNRRTKPDERHRSIH